MAESLSESPPQQGPTCPVCFRDYSDSEGNLIPRILQCGHTYCTECLERLLNMEPDEEDNDQTMIFNIHYAGRRWTTTRRFPSIFNPPRPPRNEIRCPTCKMENRIDNRDISTLTKNFALLGLRSQTAASVRPKKAHYCKDHDHEKRIYCRDCKTLICAYCQLYGDHNGHECAIATEAAKPSIETLKQAKERLTHDFDNLTQGETVVTAAIVKLEKNREKCERKVKRYFDRFIGRLKRRRDDLLLDIGSWTEDQLFVLDAQLKSLSNAIKDSESIQANCQSLIEGEPLEALTQEDDILKEVDDIQTRVGGLSFQPLINPWMKCKLTRSEYDDSIDEILESCRLKFDTDIVHKDALTLSDDEQSESESESECSALDDEDKELDLEGERNKMPFHDQAGLSGGNGSGGAARNDGDDFGDDLDALKKREQQRARLLHSQETHMGGGGASLMPKLDLAESGGLLSHWRNPSSSLSAHQSLPLLSAANQTPGLGGSGGGASNSIRQSGSAPSNTPRHDGDDPMSPTQASPGSAFCLFSHNHYRNSTTFPDPLQRAMESLNRVTEEDISDEEEDDLLESQLGESRHRLHLLENMSPGFSLFDTYGHLSHPLSARNHDDSASSDSHDASLHDDDDSDDHSPSLRPYTGSYVSTSVLDSVELNDMLRRSRLLRRMGEQSPEETEEDLDTTAADQSYADRPTPTCSPNLQHGSSSNTPSRSPLQTTEQEDTDFAYGHHLSLPVDSQGQDTEIVFPRHYSWTADHGEAGGTGGGGGGEGGGRGIRLQLEQNGTTLQVSIDSPDIDFSSVLNVSNEVDDEEREGRAD